MPLRTGLPVLASGARRGDRPDAPGPAESRRDNVMTDGRGASEATPAQDEVVVERTVALERRPNRDVRRHRPQEVAGLVVDEPLQPSTVRHDPRPTLGDRRSRHLEVVHDDASTLAPIRSVVGRLRHEVAWPDESAERALVVAEKRSRLRRPAEPLLEAPQ